MNVKVKKAGTWAITPAGPIEDIVVDQIIGEKYTTKFRQDLVDTGYADPVVEEAPKDQDGQWVGFDVEACEDKVALVEYASDIFEVSINKNKSLENVKLEIEELQAAKDAEG